MRSLVSSTSTDAILLIGVAIARAVKKVIAAAAVIPIASRIHSIMVKKDTLSLTSRDSWESIAC